MSRCKITRVITLHALSLLLICSCYGGVISGVSFSANYIAHGTDHDGPIITDEINTPKFLKKIFRTFKQPPPLTSSSLFTRVEITVEEGDESGELSVRIESNDLSERALAYAYKRIESYADLRARGYSKEYVERLMFIENIKKSKQKLSRVGRAIVDKFANVLPSKLNRIRAIDMGRWQKMIFEVHDGKNRWIYEVAVGNKGEIDEIREVPRLR